MQQDTISDIGSNFFAGPQLSEAERLLQKLGVNYSKDQDGAMKVWGDLDLSNRHLDRLPDLSRVEVSGTFSCANNNLISLEGAPQKVGGFDCSHNRLEDLKGAPQLCIGDFNCSNNHLSTLEGCPRSVFGNFSCQYNNLTSLEGGPGTAENYHAFGNFLMTLQGAPQKVDGNFLVQKNKLTSLEHGPENVKGKYFCYANDIEDKSFAPATCGEFLSSDTAWNKEMELAAAARKPLAPGIAPSQTKPTANEPAPEETAPSQILPAPSRFSRASNIAALLTANGLNDIDASKVSIADARLDANQGLLLKLQSERTLQVKKDAQGDFIGAAPGETKPFDRNDVAAIVSLGKSKGWREVTLSGNDHDKSMLYFEAASQGLQVKNPPAADVLSRFRAEYDAAGPAQPMPPAAAHPMRQRPSAPGR